MALVSLGPATSFNIDTVHPIVYEDPQAGFNSGRRQSYFGYSVQFIFGQTGNAHNSVKWLAVVMAPFKMKILKYKIFSLGCW